MYGCNAEINKVINTCLNAVAVRCACLCKGKILALVCHTAVLSDREVSDVKLIDLHVSYILVGVSFVILPAFGSGSININDHSSLAVYAGSSCIRIVDILVYLAVKVSCVGIVHTDNVAVGHRYVLLYPCAVYVLYHFEHLSCAAFAFIIKVKLYLLSCRSPYTEACVIVAVDRYAEIVARVGELVLKLCA